MATRPSSYNVKKYDYCRMGSTNHGLKVSPGADLTHRSDTLRKTDFLRILYMSRVYIVLRSQAFSLPQKEHVLSSSYLFIR